MCSVAHRTGTTQFHPNLSSILTTKLNMSFNPEKFKMVQLPLHTIVSGMLPAEVNKHNAKDLVQAILKQGSFASYQEVDEEGDIILEEKKMPLEGLIGFTIEQNGKFVQFLRNEKPQDADDEPSSMSLVNCVSFGDWLFGKQERKVAGVAVGSSDYVVLYKPVIKELPNDVDNYIASNLDWLIDCLIDDFGDKFPQDEEEIDDGE